MTKEQKNETLYEPNSLLAKHHKSYFEGLNKIKWEYTDDEDIKRITALLQKQKIKCFKYNNALDASVQTTCFYEAKIYLS